MSIPVQTTQHSLARNVSSRLACPSLVHKSCFPPVRLLRAIAVVCAATAAMLISRPVHAQGEWEFTPQSERALEQGLQWLTEHQGPDGNWNIKDLGIVSLGALAYMSAGHTPGRGRHGKAAQRALDYVLRNAKPSGLLNTTGKGRDMYNHGLTTFVLGQAYGMTNDPRLGQALERGLQVIVQTQCDNGGWNYEAKPSRHGHDLSLAVMQAKALRSAVDSGFEIPDDVIHKAISGVRNYYVPSHGRRNVPEIELRKGPGQFTYNGGRATVAMAAAGTVCMQEFGQYDDWRIPKNIEFIQGNIDKKLKGQKPTHNGHMLFDAYTMYYVCQALYQAGGEPWKTNYPKIRDHLVATQYDDKTSRKTSAGSWEAGAYFRSGSGRPWGTAVACFVLAIPNRYLPILQEGKIERFRKKNR